MWLGMTSSESGVRLVRTSLSGLMINFPRFCFSRWLTVNLFFYGNKWAIRITMIIIVVTFFFNSTLPRSRLWRSSKSTKDERAEKSQNVSLWEYETALGASLNYEKRTTQRPTSLCTIKSYLPSEKNSRAFKGRRGVFTFYLETIWGNDETKSDAIWRCGKWRNFKLQKKKNRKYFACWLRDSLRLTQFKRHFATRTVAREPSANYRLTSSYDDFHPKGLRRQMDANCGRHDLAREFPRIFFLLKIKIFLTFLAFCLHRKKDFQRLRHVTVSGFAFFSKPRRLSRATKTA